jgi:hypothetical protein
MRGSLIVGTIAFALVAAKPHAQAQPHPDLSGKWEMVDPSGFHPLGKTFTATQNATTLSLDVARESSRVASGSPTPADASDHRTYRFNGGETTATYSAPASTLNADPTRVLWMYQEASSSRAAWMGDELVIVTHYKNRVNFPSRAPSEFESETTSRLALALDRDGRLTVESMTIVDPDVDIQVRMDAVPLVVKAVYKRAS